jgi:hypothetical protein
MGKINLLPPQGAQFRCPQPMSEGQQDHCRVPVSVAIVPGRLHQPLDLFLGEVFADTVMIIRLTAPRNCSLYRRWRGGIRVASLGW